MLQLVIGVAIGAAIATAVSRVYTEREKQRLVDDLARLFEAEAKDRGEK